MGDSKFAAGVHGCHACACVRAHDHYRKKATLNLMAFVAAQVVRVLLFRSGDIELNPGPIGRFSGKPFINIRTSFSSH